jgi:ankyrin repeat protein
MAATICGFTENAKMLIDAGASLDLFGEDGRTALVIAASGCRTEIAKALIKAGAKLEL